MKKYLLIVFHIIFISACTSISDDTIEEKYIQPTEAINFSGITNFSNQRFNLNEDNFIFLIPNPSKFENFSTYFQLGVLHAYKDLKISNQIRFLNEDAFTNSLLNEGFVVGPFKASLVDAIDAQGKNSNLILMNSSSKNLSIPSSYETQLNSLNEYLRNKKDKKIAIISNDVTNHENAINADMNLLTFELPIKVKEIRNVLGVDQSEERYKIIDTASFSSLNFVPRVRSDFNQIIIFPNTEEEIYEIASTIRFNYGLMYEITSMTFNLDKSLNENEIALHRVNTFDHAYENDFGYDLKKSRSFALGYDAMLLAFAKSHQLSGEIRGFNAIYQLSSSEIKAKSYLN